uniref:Uncharacterized protein n=1 Tax=Rhizophagus irregularis (strain DAOM 181602 / DAOM 197198 / MUCL 43194) TaxID=747089 RepID=U9UD01_RHIID
MSFGHLVAHKLALSLEDDDEMAKPLFLQRVEKRSNSIYRKGISDRRANSFVLRNFMHHHMTKNEFKPFMDRCR